MIALGEALGFVLIQEQALKGRNFCLAPSGLAVRETHSAGRGPGLPCFAPLGLLIPAWC